MKLQIEFKDGHYASAEINSQNIIIKESRGDNPDFFQVYTINQLRINRDDLVLNIMRIQRDKSNLDAYLYLAQEVTSKL